MSHYTVAVILDKNIDQSAIHDAVSEALSPYDENIRTEPIVTKLKSDIVLDLINKQQETLLLADEFKLIGEEAFSIKYDTYKASYVKDFIKDEGYKLTDTQLYELYKSSSNPESFDDEGNSISTYNEDSKWDWWQIGGRWAGHLHGNDGLRLKDIQFNRVHTKSKAKLMYKENEKFKKEFKSFDKFYEYAKYKLTYSVLNSKTNEWIEPGEMGWFAQTDETVDSKIAYIKKCKELFTKDLDPEDWVIIVDCHI
jgi:hypothetical protein